MNKPDRGFYWAAEEGREKVRRGGGRRGRNEGRKREKEGRECRGLDAVNDRGNCFCGRVAVWVWVCPAVLVVAVEVMVVLMEVEAEVEEGWRLR